MIRRIVWFSCGAASAVAARLTIAEYGREGTHLVYTDPGSEHPDNVRFRRDCEEWLGHPVEVVRSGRYADTWQVWSERRFLNGPTGALCTTELKKKPRWRYQLPTDVQVFGYTAEERHRADRFRDQNPGVDLRTPLIDRGLTKDDCLAMIDRAGIELPAMYRLGYRNNNCVGCPKGGMGYWNKIRRDFPDVFDRMARLEREIGATCLRDSEVAGVDESDCDDRPDVVTRRTIPLYLDQLDPDRGDHADEPSFECSLLCQLAEDEGAAP